MITVIDTAKQYPILYFSQCRASPIQRPCVSSSNYVCVSQGGTDEDDHIYGGAVRSDGSVISAGYTVGNWNAPLSGYKDMAVVVLDAGLSEVITRTGSPSMSPEEKIDSPSTGAIVSGVVVAILFLVSILVCFVRRKKKRRRNIPVYGGNFQTSSRGGTGQGLGPPMSSALASAVVGSAGRDEERPVAPTYTSTRSAVSRGGSDDNHNFFPPLRGGSSSTGLASHADRSVSRAIPTVSAPLAYAAVVASTGPTGRTSGNPSGGDAAKLTLSSSSGGNSFEAGKIPRTKQLPQSTTALRLRATMYSDDEGASAAPPLYSAIVTGVKPSGAGDTDQRDQSDQSAGSGLLSSAGSLKTWSYPAMTTTNESAEITSRHEHSGSVATVSAAKESSTSSASFRLPTINSAAASVDGADAGGKSGSDVSIHAHSLTKSSEEHTKDIMSLAEMVMKSAEAVAERSTIPGVPEAAGLVGILVRLVIDQRNNIAAAAKRLRWCRSLVATLERASEVLGKVRAVVDSRGNVDFYIVTASPYVHVV